MKFHLSNFPLFLILFLSPIILFGQIEHDLKSSPLFSGKQFAKPQIVGKHENAYIGVNVFFGSGAINDRMTLIKYDENFKEIKSININSFKSGGGYKYNYKKTVVSDDLASIYYFKNTATNIQLYSCVVDLVNMEVKGDPKLIYKTKSSVFGRFNHSCQIKNSPDLKKTLVLNAEEFDGKAGNEPSHKILLKVYDKALKEINHHSFNALKGKRIKIKSVSVDNQGNVALSIIHYFKKSSEIHLYLLPKGSGNLIEKKADIDLPRNTWIDTRIESNGELFNCAIRYTASKRAEANGLSNFKLDPESKKIELLFNSRNFFTDELGDLKDGFLFIEGIIASSQNSSYFVFNHQLPVRSGSASDYYRARSYWIFYMTDTGSVTWKKEIPFEYNAYKSDYFRNGKCKTYSSENNLLLFLNMGAKKGASLSSAKLIKADPSGDLKKQNLFNLKGKDVLLNSQKTIQISDKEFILNGNSKSKSRYFILNLE